MRSVVRLLTRGRDVAGGSTRVFIGKVFRLVRRTLIARGCMGIGKLNAFGLARIRDHRDMGMGAKREVRVRNRAGVSFAPSSDVGSLVGGPFTRFRAIVLGRGAGLRSARARVRKRRRSAFSKGTPGPGRAVTTGRIRFVRTRGARSSPGRGTVTTRSAAPIVRRAVVRRPMPSIRVARRGVRVVRPRGRSRSVIARTRGSVITRATIPRAISPLTRAVRKGRMASGPRRRIVAVTSTTVLTTHGTYRRGASLTAVTSRRTAPSRGAMVAPIASSFRGRRGVRRAARARRVSRRGGGGISRKIVLTVVLVTYVTNNVC